jgi:hypothetical protein
MEHLCLRPWFAVRPFRFLALKHLLPFQRWISAAILTIVLLAYHHAYADAIYTVQVNAGVFLGPQTSSTGNISASGSSTVQVGSGPPPAIGTFPDLANTGAIATAGPNDLGVQSGANATANVALAALYLDHFLHQAPTALRSPRPSDSAGCIAPP